MAKSIAPQFALTPTVPSTSLRVASAHRPTMIRFERCPQKQQGTVFQKPTAGGRRPVTRCTRVGDDEPVLRTDAALHTAACTCGALPALLSGDARPRTPSALALALALAPRPALLAPLSCSLSAYPTVPTAGSDCAPPLSKAYEARQHIT
eukprot:1058488-Rhodomonas_salina.1